MAGYKEIYRKALGPRGLSANFTGTNKNEIMKKAVEDGTFKFTVKNTTDEDVTFAILQGTFPDLSEMKKKYPSVKGILADGDFIEVAENKKVTCKVTGDTSVKHFSQFFRNAIGTAKHIEMISTEKGNFQEEVQVVHANPFVVSQIEKIGFSMYLKPNQYDQNRLIADNINVPLNPFAVVLMTVCANSDIVVTLTCDVA